MRKYMNASDIILIVAASYVVIWGINHILRSVNMGAYQA